MVHDTTKADLWYHDAIIPTTHLLLNIQVLKKYNESYSSCERDIIYDDIMKEIENNRKIIYEEYLEKRRLENAER